jgi:crossover junction endodeoxyribonuclease RuvC
MRVLGVDPGTHRCGVGIIDGEGNRYKLVDAVVIKTKSTAAIEKRLYQIFQEIKRLIHEFKPDVLAIENLFFAKDIQAVVRIGEARACAMLASQEAKLPIFEYAPTSVKQSVTGNGRATKEQVQFMVTKLLSLKEAPYADSADALAIAICHLHNARGVMKKVKV